MTIYLVKSPVLGSGCVGQLMWPWLGYSWRRYPDSIFRAQIREVHSPRSQERKKMPQITQVSGGIRITVEGRVKGTSRLPSDRSFFDQTQLETRGGRQAMPSTEALSP